MAKLPEFDFRLQRSDDQPPEYSLEFAVRDGAHGQLRVARPVGEALNRATALGEARRLSGSQLQASRFDVTWEGGDRRISYGLHELAGADLEHLVPGAWYALRPERRDGQPRLEFARPEGSFGLVRLDPEPDLEPEGATEDLPAQVPGAVELAVATKLDEPVASGLIAVDHAQGLASASGLVGATGGALVRHLRRRQARDAREIARLRTELKRLHKLLSGAGVSP